MKKIIRTVIIAVLLVAGVGTVCAQNAQKQRLTREQLAEKQAGHMAEQLALDDKTSQRFVETYCRYQSELWTVKPKKDRKAQQERNVMTDSDAEKELKARFERSQKLLDIKQKYYAEYSKFLTQKQIKRVYELEKQTMNRLSKQKKNMRQGKAPGNMKR